MSEYNKDYTRWLEQNILNLSYGHYEHTNELGIPDMLKSNLTKDDIIDSKLQGFNYCLQEKHPQDIGVHFFLHDYQFERVWRYPDRYTECLRKFKYVLSPDFSPYADMPPVLRQFNIYRNRWCGRYWQDNGIEVIPTFTIGDENDFEICKQGISADSIVATSTMGEGRWGDYQQFKYMWDKFIDELQPSIVILYGKDIRDKLDTSKCDVLFKPYISTKARR